MLAQAGISPVIITGRESDILLNRCAELDIKLVYQGIKDKIGCLEKLTKDFSKVAYIGDDLNDLSCMLHIKKAGGVVGCPNDANKKIKEISDFISDYIGGEGAVRDFIEWIFDRQGKKY